MEIKKLKKEFFDKKEEIRNIIKKNSQIERFFASAFEQDESSSTDTQDNTSSSTEDDDLGKLLESLVQSNKAEIVQKDLENEKKLKDIEIINIFKKYILHSNDLYDIIYQLYILIEKLVKQLSEANKELDICLVADDNFEEIDDNEFEIITLDI